MELVVVSLTLVNSAAISTFGDIWRWKPNPLHRHSGMSVLHLVLSLLLSLLVLSPCTASFARDGSGNNNVDTDSMATSGISTNPACQSEVVRLCGRKPENLDDLDALECLMNQKVNSS